MRDMMLVSLVVIWAAYALKRPWLGIPLWVFLSIANPHRYTYGFAYSAPLAYIAAASTLVGLIFTKDRSSPFKGTPTVWMGAFTVWITISWLLGLDPSDDYHQWNKVMKVFVMTFVALALLHTKQHIIAFAWASAGSMALLGIKGGYFTIATGGNNRVWGPEGSFIADNNEFALACVMAIPLLRFLQLQVSANWQRHTLTMIMVLTAAAALGTHSRGSFLALIAMGAVLWWRGRNRLVMLLPILLVGIALIAFMPDSWVNRMESINNYEQDDSALGRFSAWWTAWGVAKNRLFGAGFLVARHELFAAYSPYYVSTSKVHAAHSIYFQVLGNHGFAGLLMFVMIWVSSWVSANWTRKHSVEHRDARWAGDLAAMAQVSLVGYLVGGTFLSLSYFDLPYNVMVLVVLSRVWVQKRSWEREPTYPSGWKTLPGLTQPDRS